MAYDGSQSGYSGHSSLFSRMGQASPMSPMSSMSAFSIKPPVQPHDTLDEAMDVDSPSSPDDKSTDPLVAASRAYQLEMFEQSMRRNIIVAMDTGTGKTRIAILRIRAELERSPPPKIVWFLAPTVLLCGQQYKAISSQIPWAQGKLITGDSNLETWQEHTWGAALLNVRFVVSTPGVLLDALNHAFVRFDSLALLVFDEAHGCVKDNNGRRIMLNFYQPSKAYGLPLPAILGLTASPVQGRNLDGFEQLETTLDSICVTPTRHRDELSFHTHRPRTHRHQCGNEDDLLPQPGPNLARLRRLERPVDPEDLALQHIGMASGSPPVTLKTYRWTWKFVENLHRRSERMLDELGPWGAEYYIHKVIRRVFRAISKRLSSENKEPFLIGLLKSVDAVRPAWPDSNSEQHDAAQAELNEQFLQGLSIKVHKLVEILQDYRLYEDYDEYAQHTPGRDKTSPPKRPMTGIIFVQQRPMAAVLARIISLHPYVRDHFKAGHVVGMTQASSGDTDESLFLSPKNPAKALQQFRAHQINLLIATSVIEEGIDIPACNLVICVDELTNLKAFIQRRGRAREINSQLHLLISNSNSASDQGISTTKKKLNREWEALEAQMKKRYEDELREAKHLQKIEAVSEVNEQLLPPLVVPATGARLTAKEAKAHLQHFCATSSTSAFVDARPIYRLVDDYSDGDTDMIDRKYESSRMTRAFVQLPNTLPVCLQRAYSEHAWRTQGDAFIDAAFQAYKKLYAAGLLTDHLLPPQRRAERSNRFIEGRENLAGVSEPYRPWPGIYQQWQAQSSKSSSSSPFLYKHAMRITDANNVVLHDAEIILPCPLPCAIEPFHLYWSAHSGRPWTVCISGPELISSSDYSDSKDHTQVLLQIAYGHRWPTTDAHRLVRVICTGENLAMGQVALDKMKPFSQDLFAYDSEPTPDMALLVRDEVDGAPYFYQGYLDSKPPVELVRKRPKTFNVLPTDIAYLALRPWPKIVGHLHATTNVKLDNELVDGEDDDMEVDVEVEAETEETKGSDDTSTSLNTPSTRRYHTVLPASTCRVDNLPMAYVQLGSLLPSLNQVIESYLVADQLLRETPLGQLHIQDRSLVVTAISTPMARLPTDYEYLEFIGDSMLKVTAVANCAAQNLMAPEGQLSVFRDRLVANSRLSRAALEFQLDQYIIARRWSLRQWRVYCAKLEASSSVSSPSSSATTAGPTMSTKTLADVVEALIGACYVDGGMPLALKCIRLFEPDYNWHSLETCREILYNAAPDEAYAPPPPALETLLGYTFKKKVLLVEAMTHASCPSEIPPPEMDYSDEMSVNSVPVSAGACMERLEFIGDAILDTVIVKHLTTTETPLSHMRTHLMRTTLVNGAFLGFTAMAFTIVEDKIVVVDRHRQYQSRSERFSANPDNAPPPDIVPDKFHKPLCAFMRHGAPRDMAPALKATARRFAALKDEILEAMWTGSEYPWALLSRLHAEKFYSDVLEAVIGAIWVDSGRMEAVEELLEKVGILPYLRRMVEDDVHVMHPKEELGALTGSAVIDYVAGEVGAAAKSATATPNDVRSVNKNKNNRSNESSQNSDDSDNEELGDLEEMVDLVEPAEAVVLYSCRLMIDGECVVEINDGVSRADAETQAADWAVKAWKRGEIKRRPKA